MTPHPVAFYADLYSLIQANQGIFFGHDRQSDQASSATLNSDYLARPQDLITFEHNLSSWRKDYGRQSGVTPPWFPKSKWLQTAAAYSIGTHYPICISKISI